MKTEVVPLFPSPVILVDVEGDTSELLTHNEFTVSNKRRKKNEVAPRNQEAVLNHGQQSYSDQRILEKYPRTKQILLNAFTSVAEEINQYAKRKYAITTSWITLCQKGDGSQLHNHKNSFWSGVYYFQEEYPEGTGGIMFDNPNADRYDFSYGMVDIERQNEINSMSCIFGPSPKLLILFPSYLRHQVLVHNNDKPRSSLAFNVVPLGHWGEHDSSYDQAWVTPTLGAWK
tara:strand:+ start:131 stop:820 length:690 start_codon:yes stop_codon:yes gene_type:complete